MLTADHSVVHHLYGIDVKTPWPVIGSPETRADRWDVEFVEGQTATFGGAAACVAPDQATWWAQSAALPDGSHYRRWRNLFEFLVTPDARQIYARMFADAHREALLAYLLVDALSFSMVRLGREPLHATTVATRKGVAGFLGPSGAGKSTLAALFLGVDGRLLTDDMLVLHLEGDAFLAQPGPPRLKLYRTVADRLLGPACSGTPMNADTDKLILALGANRVVTTPCPLDALYIIEEGDGICAPEPPAIRRLSPADAVPRVLEATAGHYRYERARMTRQFEFITRLAQRVPVSALSYRRDLNSGARVRDAVLADLGRLQ